MNPSSAGKAGLYMGYKRETNQPVCQHSMAACTVLSKAGLSQGTTYKVVLSEHTYVPTYDRPISVLTPPCELASTTVTWSFLLMTFFSSLHHCYRTIYETITGCEKQ